MKKIIFMIMVLVAGATTTTKAINPVDCEVFYKLNNETTFNGLMKYLDASGEQEESLKLVFSLTEKKLKDAISNENEGATEKAIDFNVGNVKRALSEEQYKKYLSIINLTINNRYEEVLLTENK